MDEGAHADGHLTLQQWLRRFPDHRIPEEKAVAILRQLMEALHVVHIERPFHRDIIPSTIAVHEHHDGSTTFSVSDLGREVENHGEPGARRYLAPEQWWGGRQNTFTDQYALAALFVELVTGEVPFRSAFETDDETVMRTTVCNHPAKLPSDCPRREVLLRALEKDPRARYHSCSSFLAALAGTSEESSENTSGEHRRHAHGEVPHHHRSAPRRRRRLPVFRILFALALVGGLVFWGMRAGWLLDWFERVSGMHEEAQSKRAAAARKARAEQAEASAKAREEKLVLLRAEIERQKTVADEALKTLQDFLESGGAAVLSVRREALDQARRKSAEEVVALENELAGVRRQERAYAALRMHAVAYNGVSSDIPADSEVAVAYKALEEASTRLDDLSRQFTERHPSVTEQRKTVELAQRRYGQAVTGAHKTMSDRLAEKEKTLVDLRARAAADAAAHEKIERELQVAQLRQNELERRREVESTRLGELRRKEFDLQFGDRKSVV